MINHPMLSLTASVWLRTNTNLLVLHFIPLAKISKQINFYGLPVYSNLSVCFSVQNMVYYSFQIYRYVLLPGVQNRLYVDSSTIIGGIFLTNIFAR